MKSLKNLGNVSKAFSELNNSIPSISGVVDALDGMSVEAIISATSIMRLSAAQTAQMLAANGATAADIASALAVKGYGKALTLAALEAAGYKKEVVEAAVSNVTFNTTIGASTTGLAAFGTTLKSATKGLATFLATNPVGWAILAAAAVFGVVKAYDALTVSAEEATEKMNESFSEYEEAKQKVSDLNSELETTKARIDELEAKGGLTFVEKSELEKLRESTRLLQIQADLAEREAAREGKEAAEDTLTAYEKNFKHTISSGETNSYIQIAESTGNNAGLFADTSNISAMIAGIKQLEKLRDEATDDEDWVHYSETIKEATDQVFEQVTTLADYQSKLESIPKSYRTKEQQQALDEIAASIEYIYQELDPAKWKQIKLDEILNGSDFAETKQALLDMAKASDNVGVSVDDLQSFYALRRALELASISAQEFSDNTNLGIAI